MRGPQHVTIASAGFIARRALDARRHWRVGAVFERSFYLNNGSDWLCVAPAQAGGGPLHLCCTGGGITDWRASGLRTGMSVVLNGATLSLGSRTVLHLDVMDTWYPPRPGDWSPESLKAGLDALDDALAQLAPPADGLGAFVWGDPDTSALPPVARTAAPAIEAVHAWLTERNAALPPEIMSFVGLGPGLTPSGDDFLGGLLVTLHATDRKEQSECLTQATAPRLGTDTTPISAAYVSAAMEGAGAARFHAVLNGCLTGNCKLLPLVEELARTGHTSGWDALAGMTAGLRPLAGSASIFTS